MSNVVSKLATPHKGINKRLMTACLPLPRKKFGTLITAYTPTMNNPNEVKEKFCEDLRDSISPVPKSKKLITLGDFDACVGKVHKSWEGVSGRQGVGKCNSNALFLLETCAAHDLLITNTVFRLPNQNQTWINNFTNTDIININFCQLEQF